jgi:hypothetical protein
MITDKSYDVEDKLMKQRERSQTIQTRINKKQQQEEYLLDDTIKMKKKI